MSPGSRQFRWIESLSRAYAILLYAYPPDFRAQFGRDMQQVFRDRCRAAAQTHRMARFLAVSIKDWLGTSVRERFSTGIRVPALARHPIAIWILALFISLFAGTTLVHAYVVPAGSMEGNLRIGDHMLVDRLHSHAADVHRGDIIAFRYPDDPSQTYVKRVIGLPGDRIRFVDKQVVRNGRRLIERYAQHQDSSADAYRDNFPAPPPSYLGASGRDMLARDVERGDAIVPSDSFFVLGDNRDSSFDSRYWGFVPSRNVVGKPWIVYWSYDAPTQDWTEWNLPHLADVARHFFTKTRWSRTLFVLRSQPAQEVAP